MAARRLPVNVGGHERNRAEAPSAIMLLFPLLLSLADGQTDG